jgi:hypothetical protein
MGLGRRTTHDGEALYVADIVVAIHGILDLDSDVFD